MGKLPLSPTLSKIRAELIKRSGDQVTLWTKPKILAILDPVTTSIKSIAKPAMMKKSNLLTIIASR